MFERAIVHLLIIPAAGVAAIASGLDLWGFLALEVGLSVAYEVWRIKAAAALAVGIKNVILPVGGYILLPVSIPLPSTVAVVFALGLIAATIAGVAVFVVRRRTRPADCGGRYWRRPMYALVAMLGAVSVEVFAAGAALTVPPIGVMHVGIALLAAPLWLVAYRVQDPPRPGRIRGVLGTVRDALRGVPVHSGLAAGAR